MAAVIVKQPDSISMSGNLSPLVVQTAEALPVFLSVGGEILLSETYYPGDGNLVEVDFRDVVESCLAFSFPDQDIFTQPTLARTFTVLFGAAQTVTFTAVRSGKAHLNESASSFLKGNFLTWQPTTKYVTYYSPEWLTYFAVESCSIVLKAYFSGGETQLISLTSLSAGSCVTVNLQYAVVCGKLSNRRPMYYDVWAQGSSGARLTYIQRYMASAPQSPDESWYLFENSLGGLDSLRAYGSLDFAPEFKHQIAQTSDGLQEYRIDTSRVYTRYTGYLNPAEAKWLQDLFSARQKYAYTHSGYYRIVFTSSDGAYSGADMPSSYSFSYRFAEDDPFLDIQRDEDLPKNIEIALPDQEAFFLPPRLAEYPKLEGNEDTLLLSQQPHTEEWGTLTFGEIVNGILDKLVARLEGLKLHLSNIGGGGSGDIYLITSFDLTAPSDTNAFSALRTLIEIEKAIDNSFWDIVGELDERYLRKDVDDTAHGNILFEKKIGSLDFIEGWDEGIGWEIQEDGGAVFGQANVRGNAIIGNRMGSPLFVSGFPNGVGWDLSPYKQLNAAGAEETKWRLEIDDINVRGRLRVYEFIISQLRGENDNVIFAGMMKVDHYDEATRRIYLDTDEGVLYNPFRPGDILMVQRYGGMPTEENDYNVIKQYELRVDQAEVGDLSEGEKRLDWITFTNFVGTLSDIARGDVLTRVDSVTDLTRKGIVKVTTIDEIGAPYIDVVYGMKTDPENATKARMGNLTGIRTKSGIDLTGIWGIYGNGAYFENSTYILDTGNTIEQQFSVLGGEFDSKINAIRTDISEESGNLLRNGSFASDTNYWTASNEIHYIDVGGQFLWLGGAFYVDKTKVADIVSDSGRNVLRVRNTSIYQANDVMMLPKREDTEEDGYTYSFSLFYRATRTGILKVGVPGSELYQEIDIEPNDNYSRITHAAKWDEKGDFRIECSGEVYVYGVVLYDDATADAIIKLETRIEQTEEYIKLLATKDYVDEETGEIYKKYDAEISVMAEEIGLRVTYEEYKEGSSALEKALESKISVEAGRITAVSEEVDGIRGTIASAGWITAADGNTLYASKSLENGDEIISYINQTATSLTISASRVNLNGAITINSLGYSLQQTIDGKVNRDDVGDLAYRNDVSYSYLDSWLRDYVDGKASMTDLAEYVLTTELNSKLTGYEKVGAAEDVQDYLINVLLNGTTTILGGYISTDLINADWIIANAASIGGFTIMSDLLTGDGMTLNPSTGLFFEGNSTSAAVGSSVISGATGVRCPMVAKNKYGSGGYYDNGAALILVVGSAAYNDTSQVWLSCQHDGGYGSKFMVESRYVSEISDKSFNSTVLNLGHLLKSGQVSRINSSATTKSYLCLMSDSSNNSYLCIDNG